MINPKAIKLEKTIEDNIKKEEDISKIENNDLKNNCSIKNKLISVLESQIKDSKEKILEKELIAEEEIIKIYNRLNKEIEHSRKFSLEKLITDFLPIIDSIEYSLNLIEKNKSEEIYAEIIKKLTCIYSLLQKIFKTFNIKKIDDINILFNPDIHQAMSIHYSNEIKSNQVVTVMQSGYILHESRLLRPAMVVVSKEKL